MKKFLLLLIFICTAGTVRAQDIILCTDASEIMAKVIKVSEREIEYRKWENPNGPIYTIPIRRVFMIKYPNGSKDVISARGSSFSQYRTSQDNSRYPRYQGEFSFAYGLGVGVVSHLLKTSRLIAETVHGVRINPYLFAGAGLGFNYFYGFDELMDDSPVAGMLPIFLDLKGYYPVTEKCSIGLVWDLGGAIETTRGAGSPAAFYTSIGPTVDFGQRPDGSRTNIGIRFQYMGTGLNAVLFRIGIGF